MSHQALQNFQRYTSIQHVHRIGMAERMWCDRNRERHTVSSSGGNRLPIQVLTVLSVTSQIRAFSVLPVRRLRRSMGIFSVATIVCSWLTYRVRERNQPVSLLTGGHSPAVPAAFSVRCFRVASCTNGYGGASEKSPASAPVLH